MRYTAFWRVLGIIIAVTMVTMPSAGLQAQTINHLPLITSQAITSIVAGETYKYEVTVLDTDGETVTLRLTESPENMTLEQNAITWQPTKVGTYNVVLEASDRNNGYDTQAWQITVTAAPAASLVITPNDKPTNVNLGGSQKFSARAYDQFQNEVSTSDLIWSADPAVGTIDQDGTFIATTGGLGSVTAALGEAKASSGLAVKDIRPDLVVVANTNSNANANTSNQEAATTTNAATNTDTSTNTDSQETISSDTNANTNAESTNETTEPCTNMAHWLIIIMLIIYPIILVIYYGYEKRHRSGGWWLFPIFITVIGLIVYYKYICAGTYLWWPWILVGLGVLLTWWYKGRRHSDFDSQEKLPF